MSWVNMIEPPRRVTNPGMIGGSGMLVGNGYLSPPPGASGIAQEFPEVPEKIGGGIGGEYNSLPSEEYMDIANNVALSKYYAHEFMKDWPLYLGGTAVALYLVFRR